MTDRDHRFMPYYNQLETQLTKTYGTDFPPLDPNNPAHKETLENCAQLSITQEQKNFLIAWRQVVDKTGWTLEEEKVISDSLTVNGHGITASSEKLTMFSDYPIKLLVCSIWFWKRQDEVEKILDEEDRLAIKDKIKGIDSLSKSLAAPEALLLTREKLEKELEEFEGRIKERKQKDASFKKQQVDTRAKREKRKLEEYYEKEAEEKEKARKEATISQTPPPAPLQKQVEVEEEEEVEEMTTQQLLDSHNANLEPGDLKLNLTQFKNALDLDRMMASMPTTTDETQAADLIVEYIIVYHRYYQSLVTTYPTHTIQFK